MYVPNCQIGLVVGTAGAGAGAGAGALALLAV